MGEANLDFIENAITALQYEVYYGNVKAGWWEDLTTGKPKAKGDIELILSKMMLITTEVAEAAEGVRKGLNDDHLKNRLMVEVELADAVIRILDLCGHEGYDLSGAIMEKLEYNAQRLDHKRESRMAEGGKKA